MLLGPDVLSRAAASRSALPEERWMLRQAKSVRASYVRNVIDADGDDELLVEIWMLLQPDEVRESYVSEVVDPQLP